MKEQIIEELMKECKFNFIERIIIKLHKRTVMKIYGIASKNSFNNINRCI